MREVSFPHVQLSLNFKDVEDAKELVRAVKKGPKVVLEASTPLIKSEGIICVSLLREEWPDAFIIANMGFLSDIDLECEIVAEGGADGMIASHFKSIEDLKAFIRGCEKRKLLSYLDTDSPNIITMIKEVKPHAIIFRRETLNAEIVGKAKELGIRVGVREIMELEEVRAWVGRGVDIFVIGKDMVGSLDALLETVRRFERSYRKL